MFGERDTNSETTDFTIFAFVANNSSRLIPGFRGMPDVITAIDDPVVAAEFPTDAIFHEIRLDPYLGARYTYLDTEVTARLNTSLEGPLGIMDCSHEKDGDACMQREHCNIRTPLLKIQNSIYQLLNNMTLQDMLGGTPLITIQSVATEQQGVER